MKYNLTHATLDDLPEILGLAKDFIEHVNNDAASWTEDVMVHRLSTMIREHFFIVVKDQDNIICGGLGAWIAPSFWSMSLVAEETFWWVDPTYRNTRVGHMCMKYFMTETKIAGLKPIVHLLSDSPISAASLKRHYGLVQKESTFYLE